MTRRLLWIALLVLPTTVHAIETYRLVSDALYAKAADDGAIFILTAARQATPGAWMQNCTGAPASLTRLDGHTGAVAWSTCLPISARNLAVDPRGAVTLAGPWSGLRATPGAYSSAGTDGIAVIRINPAGTAPEWIVILAGNPSYPYGGAKAWAAVAPDGSVYGTATVTTEKLPVTGTALRTDRPSYFSAYFFHLSADGVNLLYATYINDTNECYSSDLAVDSAGNVFVGGSCDSFWLDYQPSMATPGTFTTARDMWAASAWVARFDPSASAFRYVCVFGELGSLQIALTSVGQGRVAVAGLAIQGVMPFTPGALNAYQTARRGSSQSFVLVLSADGSAATPISSYGFASVGTLASDTDGNLIVAGEGTLVPTTANAWRPVAGAVYDSTFLLKLSADGARLLYATGLGCRSCTVQNLTFKGDEFWIAVADGSHKLAIADPQPVTAQTQQTTVLRAIPDNWPEVILFNGATLSWDTLDPAVLSAEIRLGAVNGPSIASGRTGVLALDGTTATYYFVDTTTTPRVLAVETFTRYTALGGIPVYLGYSLGLSPNPILSCRESPNTGTQTKVAGFLSNSTLTEVRIYVPAGPLFTMGFGPVFDTTGDWVSNGLSFFLVRAADNQVFGSARAYLLPNRSCTSAEPPEPMIHASRDCTQKNRFTLAWYTGVAPVEIREGTPDGAKVGRLNTDVGFLDVTAATAQTYWLLSWQNGAWMPVASTIADPTAPCEQGGQ